MDLATLTAQRWFAGKGRAVAELSSPVEVGGLEAVDVRYADGESERYLAQPDGFRWLPLLRTLRVGPLTGERGHLRLHAGPALEWMLAEGGAADSERLASLDQTNTLVIIGSRLLVKAYRILRVGAHPEVELLAALAGSEAPVPRFGGWLTLGGDRGEATVALLQEYVPEVASGWDAVIERAAAALRGEPDVALASFADAGAAAAVLHRVLAERLGAQRATGAGSGWRREAEDALQAARVLDPSLDADTAAEIDARIAVLERVERPLVQRIHGDLNLAQLLFTRAGVRVIDFEGNPMLTLERRRSPDTPLRDIATLLRSIDHVGSAAARRVPGSDPSAWIASVCDATVHSYEARAGVRVDRPLLHALELVAECRELAYAYRVVPEWAYVAQEGLRRLLGSAAPV